MPAPYNPSKLKNILLYPWNVHHGQVSLYHTTYIYHYLTTCTCTFCLTPCASIITSYYVHHSIIISHHVPILFSHTTYKYHYCTPRANVLISHHVHVPLPHIMYIIPSLAHTIQCCSVSYPHTVLMDKVTVKGTCGMMDELQTKATAKGTRGSIVKIFLSVLNHSPCFPWTQLGQSHWSQSQVWTSLERTACNDRSEEKFGVVLRKKRYMMFVSAQEKSH